MAVSIPIFLYKDEPTANWEGANLKIHDSEYIRIIQGEANSLTLTFHLFNSRSEPLSPILSSQIQYKILINEPLQIIDVIERFVESEKKL